MASRAVKVTIFSYPLTEISVESFIERLSKKCPGAKIKFVSKTTAEFDEIANMPAKYNGKYAQERYVKKIKNKIKANHDLRLVYRQT